MNTVDTSTRPPITFEYKKPFRLQKNQAAIKDPDIKITFLNISRGTYEDSKKSIYTFPVLELSVNIQGHMETIKIPIYLKTTPPPSETMAANSGGPDRGENQNLIIIIRKFDESFSDAVELEISKRPSWIKREWDSMKAWFRE